MHESEATVLSSLCGDTVTVSTYVVLRKGAPVDFSVLGSNQVEVTCGKRPNGCELLFDAESLRRFLADGAAALQDMDARFASKSSERAAEHSGETAEAADRA
jgi:hypothetical protein